MLAQRYPDLYNGIHASAPAVDWARLIPSFAWPQIYMNINQQFPFPCELDALTKAAIAACDPLDGVTDGLVSDPHACNFDPFSLVGHPINCSGTGKISFEAASVANITWQGPVSSTGEVLWPGPYSQAQITGTPGLANTTCTNNGTCTGVPIGLGETWLQLFVQKDPSWSYLDVSSVNEYERLFKEGAQQYRSSIDTSEPDLSRFRDGGGKLISYHGMVRELCNRVML